MGGYEAPDLANTSGADYQFGNIDAAREELIVHKAKFGVPRFLSAKIHERPSRAFPQTRSSIFASEQNFENHMRYVTP